MHDNSNDFFLTLASGVVYYDVCAGSGGVRQRARNGRDPVQQLLIKQEILSQRLACGQPVSRNDIP